MGLRHSQIATFADNLGTTKTVNFDFTPAAGETLLLWLAQAATATTPSGWTLIEEDLSTGVGYYLFSKVSDGTETDVSWTQNGDRTSVAIVAVLTDSASLFGIGGANAINILSGIVVAADAGTVDSATYGGVSPTGTYLRFHGLAGADLVSGSLDLTPGVGSDLSEAQEAWAAHSAFTEDAWGALYFNEYVDGTTDVSFDATNFDPTSYSVATVFVEYSGSQGSGSTLLAEHEETAPTASHTISFDQPTTAGREVFVAGVCSSVVPLPAGGWVFDKTYIDTAHQFVLRLPGASNPGGLTGLSFTTPQSRRLTAVAWETSDAVGAPSYGDADDDGANDGFATSNPSGPISAGTLIGTGLHTFSSDYGVGIVWGAQDSTNPDASQAASVDYGTLIGSAHSPYGGVGDEGGFIAVAITGPLNNGGSTFTLSPAMDPSGFAGAGLESNGFLAYDAPPDTGGYSFGATLAEEVALSGAPASEWEGILGAGDLDAQGFTRQISYNVGEIVQFAINSSQVTVVDIYRIGGYDTGWRKVGSIVNTPTAQPAAQTIPDSYGATDCSNWSTTASWTIPNQAWSGMYVALPRVTAPANNSALIPFIVRNDSRDADIVVKTSDTTWGAAYNYYGTPGSESTGRCLYGIGLGSILDRSTAVSYNRPIFTRDTISQTYWMNSEMPLWRFLDKQGFDWKLISSVDLDAGLTSVGNAKVLVSSGHDEYWSQGMRDNAESFRDSGGNLIFMSGNEVFWRVRFSPDRRTMYCYKDTMTGPDTHVAGDPLDPVSWTGTWRDTRWVGRDPENNLTGTFFRMNKGVSDFDIIVNAASHGSSPFWRGTTVETGTDLTLVGCIGFEADEHSVVPGASASVLVADRTFNIDGLYADENGENYSGNGDLAWGIILHKVGTSIVAGFGTAQWAWSLDAVHDRGTNVENTQAKQATINLLTDMGAVASTPTVGLVAPTAVEFGQYGLGPSTAVEILASDGSNWWRIPTGGVTDHGGLTGNDDDDHALYALADGSRGSFATTAQGTLADTAVQNSGGALSLWAGTQAEYDAIGVPDPNTVYVIT